MTSGKEQKGKAMNSDLIYSFPRKNSVDAERQSTCKTILYENPAEDRSSTTSSVITESAVETDSRAKTGPADQTQVSSE